MREIRGIEKTDSEVPEDLDQLPPRDLREKEDGLGVFLGVCQRWKANQEAFRKRGQSKKLSSGIVRTNQEN